MASDQQSYRRATNAALFGLGIQLLLAVLLGLTGLAAQAPVLYVAAFHLFGGLPIWIVLALLYHQHRLERAEALETEQLARAQAQTAALFEEHGDDLQIARRRLNNLYKWGLAVVGGIVAVYLLTVGGIFFNQFVQAYKAGKLLDLGYQEDVNRVAPFVPALFTFVLGFVAFIVARYESGMTKVSEWQVLRGGAGYLMGNALIAVIAAAGLIGKQFGRPEVLMVVTLAVPIILIVLGVEVLLTFVLNAYRPRRPGEIPRPAFDSRILGLLTSPKSLARALGDALHYQFGFEVSRSWFYQLLGKAITPLVAFALLVLVLINSIVVVQPHERALRTRFGRIVAELGPGWHLKLPWPFEAARTYPVGRVLQITVGSAKEGFKPNTAILWTNEHVVGSEDYLVTAPTPLTASLHNEAGAEADEQPSNKRTADIGLVGLQLVVQYRIKNLTDYTGQVDDPALMLTRLSERELNRFLVSKDIDTIIGHERVGAGDRLRQSIQREADTARLGLEVVFAGFMGIHPPTESDVAAAFHQQIGALQDRQRTIEDARKDAVETLAAVAGSRDQAMGISKAIEDLEAAQRRVADLASNPGAKPAEVETRVAEVRAKEVEVERLLTSARGKAAELIYDARSYRWERAIGEIAKAERFNAELLAYHQSPHLYRTRLYLRALAEGMTDTRKILIGSGQLPSPLIRIDLTDVQSTLDSLMKPK